MTTLTSVQKARADRIKTQLETASDEDRDTISIILADVVDALLSDAGAGILFVDKDGSGTLSVHIIGDYDLAPSMLRAAPDIYERLFGVPDGAIPQ